MLSLLFVKGFLVGFSLAIPVGPIGLLCIKRTLSKGRLSGIASGLGAASADFIYALMASIGLTFITDFIIKQESKIRLFGGIFLIFLGIYELLKKNHHIEVPRVHISNILKAYSSTFFITLTNLMTVILYGSVFSFFTLVTTESTYFSSSVLALGVFFGSASWFLTLSWLVEFFRAHLTAKRFMQINKIASSIFIIAGLITISTVLFPKLKVLSF